MFMTLERKELLFKDLCSRLPYNVKVQVIEVSDFTNKYLPPKIRTVDYLLLGKLGAVVKGYRKDEIKPYLFPLSSMTNELWDKEFRGWGITEFTRDSFKYGCETLEFYDGNPVLSDINGFINSLIKNHFDIYGLIPMGLALDATGLNIY